MLAPSVKGRKLDPTCGNEANEVGKKAEIEADRQFALRIKLAMLPY
jgi:hypothetical protein